MLESVQGLLHVKAMGVTNDPHMWDDLVSEANVAILKAMDSYDPEKGAFSTFACAVAYWPMFNYVRRARGAVSRKDRRFSSEQHIEVGEEEVRKHFHHRDPPLLEQREAFQELREQIELLRDAEKEVLLLMLKGHSQVEVSRMLGVTRTAVYIRRKRAIQKLRKYYARKNF